MRSRSVRAQGGVGAGYGDSETSLDGRSAFIVALGILAPAIPLVLLVKAVPLFLDRYAEKGIQASTLANLLFEQSARPLLYYGIAVVNAALVAGLALFRPSRHGARIIATVGIALALIAMVGMTLILVVPLAG